MQIDTSRVPRCIYLHRDSEVDSVRFWLRVAISISPRSPTTGQVSTCVVTASALTSRPLSQQGDRTLREARGGGMTRYAIFLAAPVVVGVLIAVAILLINGLRERHERRRMELREARTRRDSLCAVSSSSSIDATTRRE